MAESVLIVTYYWPPSGGAAVQRWLSLANELAEQGVSVFVLTVDEKYATYQLYDKSLSLSIHNSIKVFTTKTIEPFGIYKAIFGKQSIPKPAFSDENNPSFAKKVSRFLRGNLFIPDPRKGWKPFAVRKGIELVTLHKIKCVITAGPPHSTHFIGRSLKEKLGIFWIADFHDLWTDVIYYNLLYHLPVVKKIDKRLEKNVLETADRVITVGEKYKQRLLSKSAALTDDKFMVLRIGYDENLFKCVAEPVRPPAFTITYTGTIASYYHPSVLFVVLQKLRNKYSDVPFRIRFVGILAREIKFEIKENGLEDILEETGYVAHHEAIQYLLNTTLLLLVNPEIPDEEMIIPGKLYEYLAAQKPIINITRKKAETSLIIARVKAGETFERDMEKQLSEYLEVMINRWRNNERISNDNYEEISHFSRREIAHELLNLVRQQQYSAL